VEEAAIIAEPAFSLPETPGFLKNPQKWSPAKIKYKSN
jgi:hypothetical protein